MNEEAVRGARDLAKARAGNRSSFHLRRRMAAELRKFFPGVRVRYAKEGQHEMGKRLV